MSFRYIGSKARLVEAILAHVGPPTGGNFVDAFCGTGAVAEGAARSGWPVVLNDNLHSAVMMARARLISQHEAPFKKSGGYEATIRVLNSVPGHKGGIWRHYSPASHEHAGIERRYFTEENAAKIDGIRKAIADWKQDGQIGHEEEMLLVADLMNAANRVANTAGTYGCFLSSWQRQSLDALVLVPRDLPLSSPRVTVSVGDVIKVPCRAEDLVYLDPPYTKRQYAAYYHILETIALCDEPEVTGVCGIRPWHHLASDYCYRTRAAKALRRLIETLPARRVLLSYSTEGHVPLEVLARELEPIGRVSTHTLMQVGRYRPNSAASKAASDVGEVLISVERAASSLEEAA